VTEDTKQVIGKYRWRILALLFFATTINYIDRQVIGILKPFLQNEMHWSEADYGYMVSFFQGAYALGYIFMGWLMDKLGTRKGFSIAIIVWSMASMLTAAASSISGFIVARFTLGLGESGNFPACIKTVAEWFPKKERSFATGIFNSGSNIGAIVAPILVPVITINFGWRWAFIFTGALGFVWLAFWLLMYKKPEVHPSLGIEELAYIQSDPIDLGEQIPRMKLLPKKRTLAFAFGKFLTDPIWWIYLFWLPDFLNKEHGLDLSQLVVPLIIVYLFSDLGSIFGGWLGTNFLRKGWSVNRARKTTMLICALCVVPIMLVPIAHNLYISIALISLAAAAHQGWSANLLTLPSDLFPQKAVGSVVGIGGTLGAIGGMLISALVGFILQATGSYYLIFLMAGSAYLLALLVIHLLVPKMDAQEFPHR
jgi:ACS family hexuronate transporter-like MFS transporter